MAGSLFPQWGVDGLLHLVGVVMVVRAGAYACSVFDGRITAGAF